MLQQKGHSGAVGSRASGQIAVAMILSLACSVQARGQNLVPNGSFELIDTCPIFWNQLAHAEGWNSFRGSPDLFNACDTLGLVDVPENVVGYQIPSDGEGYAGAYVWCDFPANSRELIGVQLSQPLTPWVPVHLSFKVSPTSGGAAENMRWTCAGMGMRFSMGPYFQDGLAPLPNTSALSMSVAPDDTVTWYLVSGWYVPDSAYEYVILGNFFDDTQTVPVLLDSAASFPCAYVYVDEVCVSYDAIDCGLSAGVLSSVGAIENVFPNPFVDICHIRLNRHHELFTVILVDALGNVVFEEIAPRSSSDIILEGQNLAPGTYILMAKGENGGRAYHLLVRSSP
ncbi:MAG: T9SS type A sorting domain-containing protein [Flavobacteriales bacterium]|nr:T9SS type A sorting domain-containing protein [Flavobacteriales bacterium]MBK9288305.1 T9SS type A sorting domain-containing protein [Flavobacteriales bacterium]